MTPAPSGPTPPTLDPVVAHEALRDVPSPRRGGDPAEPHGPVVPVAAGADDDLGGGRLARRLHADLLRVARERPRTARTARAVARRPVTVLVLLAAALGLACGFWTPDADQARFRLAGEAMLGPGFLDVFADSWVQIGPLFLLSLGAASAGLRALGVAPSVAGALIAAAEAAGLVALLLLLVRRASGSRPALVAQWAVGGVVVAGGFLADVMLSDHPEELAVGLLLALAGLAGVRGRPGLAGLLVAAATGLKQWGPIGGGVLLAGRGPRRVLVALGVCAAGVAVLYGPFRLWGEMHTFDLQWPFPEDSLLDRLAGWAGASDWTLRVVQGAVAGLVGAAVAVRRHGSVLVVVICAISARLLLDPLRLTYYWAPLVAVLLVWMWTTDVPAVRRVRGAVTVLLPLAPLVPYVLPYGAWWLLGDVVTCGLPVACLVLEARRARALRHGDAVPVAPE